MTYSEANMLPKDSPISKEYDKFVSMFGEEGNLIVIGVEADKITQAGGFNRWNMLARDLQKFPQVEGVLSLNTIKELYKDTIHERFATRNFFPQEVSTQGEVDSLFPKLFDKTPVYEGLLYNKDHSTLRMAVSLRKDIVNTAIRKDFILKD